MAAPTDARTRSIGAARRALIGAASLAVAFVPLAAASAATQPHTALFATPSAITSIGPWMVVADHPTSSLTILNAATGALVRDVNHAALHVTAPTSVAADVVSGRRLVLVAGTGGPVAELALAPKGASVAVTRRAVLRPSGCRSTDKAFLATDLRGDLVEACQDGVVTEWHLATGAVVQTFTAKTTGLADATGIAVLGADAYVTNTAAGASLDGVAQLDLATGRLLRTVTNTTDAAYAFSAPSGIASDGTHLWEINAAGNTVDELTAATLRFVATSSTNLSDPLVVLASPSYVWVSSSGSAWSSSMVTQFQVVNGALSSPWMMCNSNGPYKFDDPSGFALHGGTLWVANHTNSLVDKMNSTTGALLGTYS